MNRGVSQIRKNPVLHTRERSQDSKHLNKHEQKYHNTHKEHQPERTKSPLKKFLQLRLGKHYSSQLKDMMQLLEKQKKLRLIMDNTTDPIKRQEIQSMINFLKNQEEHLIKNTNEKQRTQQNNKQQNLLIELNKYIHGKNSKLINQQQICQQIKRTFVNQSRTLQIIFNQLQELCKEHCKSQQDKATVSFAQLLSKIRKKMEGNKKGKQQQLMKKILQLEKNNVRLTKECHKIEEEFEYLVQEKLLLQSKLDRAKIMVKATQTEKCTIVNKYINHLNCFKKDIEELQNANIQLKQAIQYEHSNFLSIWRNNFLDLSQLQQQKNQFTMVTMKDKNDKQNQQMKQKIIQQANQISQLQTLITQKQHQLNRVKKELNDFEEFLKQRQNESLQNLLQKQQMITSIKEQTEQLKNRLQRLKVQSRSEKQKLQQQIEVQEYKNKQLLNKCSEISCKFEQMKSYNDQLRVQQQKLLEKITMAAEENQNQQQKKNKQQVIIYQQQLIDLQSELQHYTQQKMELHMELQNKNNQIYLLQSQNKNQQSRLTQILQQRQEIADAYQLAQSQKNQYLQQIKTLTEQYQQFKQNKQLQIFELNKMMESNCSLIVHDFNKKLAQLDRLYAQSIHNHNETLRTIQQKLIFISKNRNSKNIISDSIIHKLKCALKQLKQLKQYCLLFQSMDHRDIINEFKTKMVEVNEIIINQENKKIQIQQIPPFYAQALESLLQEFLLNKVNLEWRNQLQQITPQKRQKITNYRNKIAQLQLQIRHSEESHSNHYVTKSAVLNIGNHPQAKNCVATSLLPGIKSQNENSIEQTLQFSYVDISIPAQILQLSAIESTQGLLLRQIQQLRQQNEQLRSQLQSNQQQQVIFDF